ncbi:MAG TPA: rhomboid family intramembrane serine protease [Flavobacterium sp.]|jgi:membrane associated rhomboid family serine protease|nr:rhomboid family intramembrane serine protease [Flavobacterium sp.]
MMNITPVVKQLLILNIIFFIGTELVGEAAVNMLALFYPEHPAFQIWQIISHMFMHGGLMHLAFNMFALYSFGSALEHYWGGGKFLFFYISCGLGSALLHTGVNYYIFENAVQVLEASGISRSEVIKVLTESTYIPGNWADVLPIDQIRAMASAFNGVAVGASGAIYGLLVAFAFMFPNAELALLFIPIPIKAKYFVTGLLLLDLFLGVKGDSIFGAGGTGVAHFAHIGGALIGFLMMWYWKKTSFNKNRWN